MTDHLDLAARDLATITEHHDTAIRRLNDQLRGQPGSGFGGNGSRGNSSPVETALGIGGPGDDGTIRGDQAARKLEAIGKLRHTICRDLHLLAMLVTAEVPRVPTDKERREVEGVNAEGGERLCEHCTDHRRLGDAQEVHRTSTVNGNLPHAMGLCRWCYDRVREDGKLPNGDRLARLKTFKADAVRT